MDKISVIKKYNRLELKKALSNFVWTNINKIDFKIYIQICYYFSRKPEEEHCGLLMGHEYYKLGMKTKRILK